MKSEIIFFARLVPVVVCLVAIATGQDRIHLNSGEVIEGRIDLVTDEHIRLNIRIETSSGRGEGRRVLPVDLVEWIDFQPSPLEIKLIAGELKESDLLALQKEVSEGIKRVVHPRSRTGDLAIAWGRLLLLNGDSTALQEGIRWLDGVIGSDWDAQRRDQARIVQWRMLILMDKAGESIDEVRAWLKETRAKDLLLEGYDILAEANVWQFRKLIVDHPKWFEDSEIVQERARLYHEVHEGWLFPFLFYGSEDEVAARSLMKLAQFCNEAEEPNEAKHYCNEILLYYAETTAAEDARSLLTLISPAP